MNPDNSFIKDLIYREAEEVACWVEINQYNQLSEQLLARVLEFYGKKWVFKIDSNRLYVLVKNKEEQESFICDANRFFEDLALKKNIVDNAIISANDLVKTVVINNLRVKL
ncbi:hypothetical protein [Thiopseudomonas alkaliphila]|uniref:hypothetical protein n=1 Tax=Thiopseudomonas alkaliphila TaxID=1697053 RepID=UPI00069E8606|nr:hypothetical protein [Thiopseudomonas alkaliphila]AKX52606.1 hypothetical protein AKN91_02140 [Thiopseudomonas alkaliphila]